MSPYNTAHLSAAFASSAISLDPVSTQHHLSQLSPSPSSQACNSSLLYNPGHVSFPNSDFSHHRSFSDGHHTPSQHVALSNQNISLNPASLPSSIGPHRVRTRQQHRAQQQMRQQSQTINGQSTAVAVHDSSATTDHVNLESVASEVRRHLLIPLIMPLLTCV